MKISPIQEQANGIDDYANRIAAIFPIKHDSFTLEWLLDMKKEGCQAELLAAKQNKEPLSGSFLALACPSHSYERLIGLKVTPIPLSFAEEFCKPIREELKRIIAI